MLNCVDVKKFYKCCFPLLFELHTRILMFSLFALASSSYHPHSPPESSVYLFILFIYVVPCELIIVSTSGLPPYCFNASFFCLVFNIKTDSLSLFNFTHCQHMRLNTTDSLICLKYSVSGCLVFFCLEISFVFICFAVNVLINAAYLKKNENILIACCYFFHYCLEYMCMLVFLFLKDICQHLFPNHLLPFIWMLHIISLTIKQTIVALLHFAYSLYVFSLFVSV